MRILFLTENTAPEIVRAALLTGARGYVVESFAGRELMPALDALLLDCYFVRPAEMTCEITVTALQIL